MTESTYTRPASVAGVVAALERASDPVVLAGGQTLVPALGRRRAARADLVDLGGVAELRTLTVGPVVRIGAMCTHETVTGHTALAAAVPGLTHAIGVLADPQVRRRATIGGALADADPHGDYPAILLGLGATVVTDRRRMPAPLAPAALETTEVIVAVEFSAPRAAGYARLGDPARRNARAGAFVADTGDGPCVAVCGVDPSGAVRGAGAERALAAGFSPGALDDVHLRDDAARHPSADSDYVAHLATVLARRALARTQRPRATSSRSS